jgi:hypothetical protein
MYGKDAYKFWLKNLTRTVRSEDLGMYGRIILK